LAARSARQRARHLPYAICWKPSASASAWLGCGKAGSGSEPPPCAQQTKNTHWSPRRPGQHRLSATARLGSDTCHGAARSAHCPFSFSRAAKQNRPVPGPGFCGGGLRQARSWPGAQLRPHSCQTGDSMLDTHMRGPCGVHACARLWVTCTLQVRPLSLHCDTTQRCQRRARALGHTTAAPAPAPGEPPAPLALPAQGPLPSGGGVLPSSQPTPPAACVGGDSPADAPAAPPARAPRALLFSPGYLHTTAEVWRGGGSRRKGDGEKGGRHRLPQSAGGRGPAAHMGLHSAPIRP